MSSEFGEGQKRSGAAGWEKVDWRGNTTALDTVLLRVTGAPGVFIIHAPGEGGTHHECGEFSGVNETPLLRGIEFTHVPSQAQVRMAGLEQKGKLDRTTSHSESQRNLFWHDLEKCVWR